MFPCHGRWRLTYLKLPAQKGAVHLPYRFEGDKIAEEWDLGRQVLDNSLNENSLFLKA